MYRYTKLGPAPTVPGMQIGQYFLCAKQLCLFYNINFASQALSYSPPPLFIFLKNKFQAKTPEI